LQGGAGVFHGDSGLGFLELDWFSGIYGWRRRLFVTARTNNDKSDHFIPILQGRVTANAFAHELFNWSDLRNLFLSVPRKLQSDVCSNQSGRGRSLVSGASQIKAAPAI